MKIPIENIIIGDRIRKNMGNIKELANDIKLNGLIQPIVITTDNKLIAGERRIEAHKILKRTNIECVVMKIKDYKHKILCEIAENENRKEFTMEERVQFGMQLEKIEAVKAKERQGKRKDINDNNNNNNDITTFPSYDRNVKVNAHETAEIVAKAVGLGSSGTYKRAKSVVNSGKRDVIDKMNSGELKVYAAFNELKKPELKRCDVCNMELEIDMFVKKNKTCRQCDSFIKVQKKGCRELLKKDEYDFSVLIDNLKDKPSKEGNIIKKQPDAIISRLEGFLNTINYNFEQFENLNDIQNLEQFEIITVPLITAIMNLDKIKKLMEVIK